MKLRKLIKDLPISVVKGSKEIEVTGICAHSKLTSPGNLFVARKGLSSDGVKYIPEAISAGASAILCDIYDPSLKGVTQLVHPNVATMEALLAARYYQFSSDQLFMVGITGTNGKTTTSFLVKYLLDHFCGPCGLIGTIEYLIGEQRYQATRTTPDVVSNHKMLREMVLHGSRSAVMEVTSHALDQHRIEHIEFDVAIFTNLTVDHLDYHKTLESYCKAKAQLFSSLQPAQTARKKQIPKFAVVNIDSSWAPQILENCPVKILSYGIQQPADLSASAITLTPDGASFTLNYQGKSFPCNTPLIGRHNVYNTLAAVGAIITRGISIQKIVPLISNFPSIPGRLEQIKNDLGLKIYVDFAHSNDALANVLDCLSEFKGQGKLITVFGCGGDRDSSKRPLMAKVCETLSDLTIVTTDNPRSEDPLEILKQIVTGFQFKKSYLIEPDRYQAIQKAIELATPQDIILIAGKGHEPYQIFAHQTIEFDDRKVATQLCQQKIVK